MTTKPEVKLPEPVGRINEDGEWFSEKLPYKGKYGDFWQEDEMHEYGAMWYEAGLSQAKALETLLAAAQNEARIAEESLREVVRQREALREELVACARAKQATDKSFEDWWKRSTISWSPLGAAREAWHTQQFVIDALKHDIEQYASASTALALQLDDKQSLAQPDPSKWTILHNGGSVTADSRLDVFRESSSLFTEAEAQKALDNIRKSLEAESDEAQPGQDTQGCRRVFPPNFPPMPKDIVAAAMSREDLWAYACLTGWRCGDFEKQQPAQERHQAKNREEIMKQWDRQRASIAAGNTSSGPRDWFESILDSLAEQQPAQAAVPEVCCGDYESCVKPCTPRGIFVGKKSMAQPVAEEIPDAVKQHNANIVKLLEDMQEDFERREGNKWPECRTDAASALGSAIYAVEQSLNAAPDSMERV